MFVKKFEVFSVSHFKMGRKRKIPPGYIPTWKSDSDTCSSEPDPNFIPEILYSSQSSPTSVCTSPTPKRQRKLEQEEDHQQQQQHKHEEEDHHQHQHHHHEEEDHHQQQQHTLEEDQQQQQQHHHEEDQQQQEEEEEEMEEEEEEWRFFLGNQEMPSHFDNNMEDEHDNEEEEEEEEEELVLGGDDEEDKTSFSYILSKFSEDWLMEEMDHKVSKQASSAMWNVASKWMGQLASAFEQEKKKKFPKLDHIRRKLVKKRVPRISMDIGYVNKETEELTVVKDSDKLPIRDFPPSMFEKVFEIASVKVKYMPFTKTTCF